MTVPINSIPKGTLENSHKGGTNPHDLYRKAPIGERPSVRLTQGEQTYFHFPEIHLDNGYVWCNRQRIDLRSNPLSFRLFEAFYLAQTIENLSDETITAYVYEVQHIEVKSPQFRASLRGRMTKLVGRTRRIIAQQLGESSLREEIEWFYYRPIVRSWDLFRLRLSYLLKLKEDFEVSLSKSVRIPGEHPNDCYRCERS